MKKSSAKFLRAPIICALALIAGLFVSVAMCATSDHNITNVVGLSSPAIEVEDSPRSDFLLNFSTVVVTGEVKSSPKEITRETPHEHLWYYYYPFKVDEVLKGKVPPESTIEVAIVWSSAKGDPSFLKAGDKLILFLEKPIEARPAWLALNREDAVQSANPRLIASWKKLIAAGPVRPFSGWGQLTPKQCTTLDLHIFAITNVITPMSKRLTNGQVDVVELPIRIENSSAQTITASISHEWFGGILPASDLGAAAKRIDEPTGWWQANAVYLSGELGTITEPTVWHPGESHDFVLRMNWPGTGSRGAIPLIAAQPPGKYEVRVSLVFKVGEAWEYFVSPTMQIEVGQTTNRSSLN